MRWAIGSAPWSRGAFLISAWPWRRRSTRPRCCGSCAMASRPGPQSRFEVLEVYSGLCLWKGAKSPTVSKSNIKESITNIKYYIIVHRILVIIIRVTCVDSSWKYRAATVVSWWRLRGWTKAQTQLRTSQRCCPQRDGGLPCLCELGRGAAAEAALTRKGWLALHGFRMKMNQDEWSLRNKDGHR